MSSRPWKPIPEWRNTHSNAFSFPPSPFSATPPPPIIRRRSSKNGFVFLALLLAFVCNLCKVLDGCHPEKIRSFIRFLNLDIVNWCPMICVSDPNSAWGRSSWWLIFVSEGLELIKDWVLLNVWVCLGVDLSYVNVRVDDLFFNKPLILKKLDINTRARFLV